MSPSPIITTKVLLSRDNSITGEEEETWVDCAFKLSKVAAIRQPVDNDENGGVVIYFGTNEYWIIQMDYKTLYQLWKSQTV